MRTHHADGWDLVRGALLALAFLATSAAAGPQAPAQELPVYEHWRTFNVDDGLPSDKVLCVLVDGAEVWAGTEKGLARRRDGAWQVLTTADGLAHDVVVALALSADSGDLWVGTMGGLSRVSGGAVRSFTQLDSGLINDVIYAVATVGPDVWVATASGVSVLHPASGTWELYNHQNTLMHEPWCYGLTSSPERVWIAVWGGGVVEHEPQRGTWKAYRDPDGEMELDLVRDDGLVHDVTSAVAWDGAALWVGTYFGLSRYDGRTWRTWLEHESPLPSNFVNFVRARDGWAWIATDAGLAASDGERWVVYARGEEPPVTTLRVQLDEGAVEERALAAALPHGFVFGVAPVRDGVWVATGRGLALGTRATPDHREER